MALAVHGRVVGCSGLVADDGPSTRFAEGEVDHSLRQHGTALSVFRCAERLRFRGGEVEREGDLGQAMLGGGGARPHVGGAYAFDQRQDLVQLRGVAVLVGGALGIDQCGRAWGGGGEGCSKGGSAEAS